MYARHDLAWLTEEGWRQVLASTPAGTPAHAAISRWSSAGWPLVVRSSDTAAGIGRGAAEVCLGLAAPPDPASGAKMRLPLRAGAAHIARYSLPLPLDAAAHALPAHWQAPYASLCESAEGLDLRVFGSLALQALTGQAYLRPGSDIDLLFRPRNLPELDAGIQLLAAHRASLPLDGEIVFPSGEAVAWKEWFASTAGAERVLAKSHTGAKLLTRAHLRAGLEAA